MIYIEHEHVNRVFKQYIQKIIDVFGQRKERQSFPPNLCMHNAHPEFFPSLIKVLKKKHLQRFIPDYSLQTPPTSQA